MSGRSTGVQCTVFFIHICVLETFIIPFKQKGQKEVKAPTIII